MNQTNTTDAQNESAARAPSMREAAMRNQRTALSLIATVAVAATLLFSSSPRAAQLTRTSAFDYDAATGLLTKEIVEPGDSQLCVVTTYAYDAYGNKTGSTTRNCNGSAGTHPGVNGEAVAPGAPAAFVSRTTNAGYTSDGRFASSTTNALSHADSKTYDGRFGEVTALTGPNGLITRWKYDSFGRKVLEARADGNGTKWEYLYCLGSNGGSTPCPTIAFAQGKYLVRTTPVSGPIDINAGTTGAANGPATTVYFDMLDREIRSQTEGYAASGAAPAIYKDTEYNARGQVFRVSRPYFAGNTVYWEITNSYDILGRVLTVTTRDENNAAATTTFTYNGLSTTLTNAKGKQQTKTNNSVGKLWRVTDAYSQTITFTYDPNGNPTTTVDAAGNARSIAYDLRGRKTSMVDGDMGTWLYEHNAAGELVKQTDAKSSVTTLTYDKLSRMTQRVEPDLISTWYYDVDAAGAACGKGTGKLCESRTDAGYRQLSNYDVLGRPSASTTTLDVAYSASTAYDANGRVADQTFPSGLRVKNVYNALGYLKELRNYSDNTLYWQANTIDASGQVTSQAHGNGVVTTQAFSPYSGRLTNITAGTANAVQSLPYVYDVLGNISVRQDNNQNLVETFTYDDLNRVVSASLNASATGFVTTSYGYDAIGNLICKSDLSACSTASPNLVYGAQVVVNGATRTLPHAVKNAVGTVHGTSNPSYTYDANGAMLSGGNSAVAYTSYGMTTQITAPGKQGVRYVYGPEHQRVREDALSPAGAVLSSTYYLHPDSSNGLFYEVERGASTVHKHYLAAAGQTVALVTYDGSTWANKYFHRDNLGSVTAVTDQAGAVLERMAYDPWGKRRYPSGAADPADAIAGANTDRGFTNHEHIDALGLVNMNGRVYDPSLARFMAADPMITDPTNLQSHNRYSYVINNPLGLTDPSGYHWLSKEWLKIWRSDTGRAVVAIVVAYVTSGLVSGSEWALCTESGATWGSVAAGSAGGFAGGLVSSGGNLEAGFKGALTGGAFGYVGQFQGGSYANYAGHAAVGCVSGAMNGDGCGRGAASQLVSKYITIEVHGGFAGTVAAGGLASSVTGGKFANGAMTAAYGYLFNSLAHPTNTYEAGVRQAILRGDVGELQALLGNGVLSAEDALIAQRALTAMESLGPEGAQLLASRYGVNYANTVNHAFGQAKHNLGPLVQEFGSPAQAFVQVQTAVDTAFAATGNIPAAVQVGRFTVQVRGAIMDGVAQIRTLFIPK
jgi:RHS repeat-associated protein